MNTKHTAGTWEIIGRDKGLIQVKEGSEYKNIAMCCYGTHEEAYANAKLIATAPEMLEVLQAIVNKFDSVKKVIDSGLSLELNLALSVIQKAIK